MAVTMPNPTDKEDFAHVLARFACSLSLKNLPAQALLAAKANVLDTLACAVAGSSAQGVGETYAQVMEWGGSPQASVLVFGDRVPAHHAAWVNGSMAHARDYDDTHDAAVLHAGVSVVPAALAAAQLAGVTRGEDFMAGVAAGLETICRLGMATRITIIESGYMYTALLGHFAATVAAARVLRLTPEQTVNALGIAYSQVAGNHQVTRDAALTKRMQPGFAAMAALVSVQMARRGIRGAQATFEGEDGFFRVYLHDRVDREALREGLGQWFEFQGLSYKPYPCCRFNHPAIDATLALRAQHGIEIGNIRRVRVGLNHQAHEAVCTPLPIRKAPQTIVQAQFSIPYTVATAWVAGCVELRHFTEQALQDPQVLALAGKVEPFVDADIEKSAGRNVSPVRVAIELNDGRVLEQRVDVPLGHPTRPMSAQNMQAKVLDCLRSASRPMPTTTASQLGALVDQIEDLDDVGQLLTCLQAGA